MNEMRKLMESAKVLTESTGSFVLLRVEATDPPTYPRYYPMRRENSLEHAIMYFAWHSGGYEMDVDDDAERFVQTELAGRVEYYDGLALIDMKDRVGEYWYVMSF